LTAEGLPLSQASFRNANLTGASFRNSDMANCDFTGANLAYADFTGVDLTGSTGFDAEQPGMQFGPRPGFAPGPFPSTDPRGQGTVLPDRSVRNGVNPGTPPAPATVPPRIVLNIDDSGAKYTLDLAFAGDQFSQGVGGPNLGKFTYSARPTLATLKLIYTLTDVQTYTLLFDSPKAGKLFYQGNNRGIYLIGTFQIL
jgi:hypothetical protein